METPKPRPITGTRGMNVVDRTDTLLEALKKLCCSTGDQSHISHVNGNGEYDSYHEMHSEVRDVLGDMCLNIKESSDDCRNFRTIQDTSDGGRQNICYVMTPTLREILRDYDYEDVERNCTGEIYYKTFGTIPAELCDIYSPDNNLVLLAFEAMQGLHVDSHIGGRFELANSVEMMPDEKIAVNIRDTRTGEEYHGGVKCDSDIEEECYSKLPKYVHDPYDVYGIPEGKHSWEAGIEFFSRCSHPKMVFTLFIGNTDAHYSINIQEVNRITCYFHEKGEKLCCAIERENTNFEVSYVGRMKTYEFESGDFHSSELIESLNCRMETMEKYGIYPSPKYFEQVKYFRKKDIKHFMSRRGEIRELTRTMKKYQNARDRCIKNKIILICMCLKRFDIRVPTEMWIKILSFPEIGFVI